MAAWYDDALKLRDFADALEKADYADASDILKKPYRFDDEYEIWRDNDYPNPEDKNWDDFIEGLTNYSQAAEAE